MQQTINTPSQGFAGKTWSELPPAVRTGFIIVGSGLAVWGGIKLVQFIQKQMEEAKYKETSKQAGDELKAELKAGNKLTYSESTYSGWANSIQSLVSGCDFNKNDASVMQLISNVKNNADWLMLVKKFGSRSIEGCSPTWTGLGNYTGDLPTVLKRELLFTSTNAINSWLTKHGVKSTI